MENLTGVIAPHSVKAVVECSDAGSPSAPMHGRHVLPFVFIGAVALHGVEVGARAIVPIAATHSIHQVVYHSHT